MGLVESGQGSFHVESDVLKSGAFLFTLPLICYLAIWAHELGHAIWGIAFGLHAEVDVFYDGVCSHGCTYFYGAIPETVMYWMLLSGGLFGAMFWAVFAVAGSRVLWLGAAKELVYAVFFEPFGSASSVLYEYVASALLFLMAIGCAVVFLYELAGRC